MITSVEIAIVSGVGLYVVVNFLSRYEDFKEGVREFWNDIKRLFKPRLYK